MGKNSGDHEKKCNAEADGWRRYRAGASDQVGRSSSGDELDLDKNDYDEDIHLEEF